MINQNFPISDVFSIVCVFLSPKDLLCVGLINKELRKLTNSEFIWKNIFDLHGFRHETKEIGSLESKLEFFKFIHKFENWKGWDFRPCSEIALRPCLSNIMTPLEVRDSDSGHEIYPEEMEYELTRHAKTRCWRIVLPSKFEMKITNKKDVDCQISSELNKIFPFQNKEALIYQPLMDKYNIIHACISAPPCHGEKMYFEVFFKCIFDQELFRQIRISNSGGGNAVERSIFDESKSFTLVLKGLTYSNKPHIGVDMPWYM